VILSKGKKPFSKKSSNEQKVEKIVKQKQKTISAQALQ
jgi:hypothetical protein